MKRTEDIKKSYIHKACRFKSWLSQYVKTLNDYVLHNMDDKLRASIKARLHRRFLSRQLDAIFVARKLQLQNRA